MPTLWTVPPRRGSSFVAVQPKVPPQLRLPSRSARGCGSSSVQRNRSMRFRVFGTLFALVLATLAVSCGSDSTRPDPEWQPTARTPYTGDRWWWTPVERHCEEDEDCEAGETCV